MKVVIIGGVATGMSAAAKIKRDNPEYEVVVLERGYEVSYGACGLPYYISGVNEDESLLVARTEEEFIESGIDLRVGNEVVALNPARKEIKVVTDEGKEYIESYDKCVLAMGASPIKPGFKGSDLENVVTLSTIEDANNIKEILKSQDIKNVVIIGGGPIGIELVESFYKLDKKVIVVEMQDSILNNFDPEIGGMIKNELIGQGIDIRTGESLESIEGATKVERIITNKDEIKTDLLVLALGVRPNTQFLSGSGIETLGNGAVLVNKRMETSIDSIYAGGDCASIYNRILDEDGYIALGTNANKQGRIIAENIGGKNLELNSILGSSMLKVNNIECAATGINERQAKDAGINYKTNMIKSITNAGYYPGFKEINIKIIYDGDTRVILGAQLLGEKDVALRMNTLAVCIHNKMTLEEIEYLDLGYAPPFATVWDPIHRVAQSAE